MTNKELIEDLLIEFDECDMQPMLIVPDPLERAKAWKHELTYAIRHLKAEIAREIFEEIIEEIFNKRIAFYTDMAKQSKFTEKHYAETMIRNCKIYLQEIAELKKKYTE